MLPKLDETCDFKTLKLKVNKYYIVACRVTPLKNSVQSLGGQILDMVFRIHGILLIYKRSTEQLSTSLAFLSTKNSIGWAAEITGQLLCLVNVKKQRRLKCKWEIKY